MTLHREMCLLSRVSDPLNELRQSHACNHLCSRSTRVADQRNQWLGANATVPDACAQNTLEEARTVPERQQRPAPAAACRPQRGHAHLRQPSSRRCPTCPKTRRACGSLARQYWRPGCARWGTKSKAPCTPVTMLRADAAGRGNLVSAKGKRCQASWVSRPGAVWITVISSGLQR